MLAPQIPPIMPTTIIPIYKNSVFAESLPSAKKSIITVTIKKYKIEDITPATIPLNAVNLEEKIPQKNPPSIMQAIKIALTELVSVSAFAKTYEKTKERIKLITAPITADNKTPIIFFAVTDISFFRFNTFLRIKNPSHSIKNMRESFIL